MMRAKIALWVFCVLIAGGIIGGFYKFAYDRGYNKRSAELVLEVQDAANRATDVRSEVAAGAGDVPAAVKTQAKVKTVYDQAAIRRVGVLEGRIDALREKLDEQREAFDIGLCPLPGYVLREQAELNGILRGVRGANRTGDTDDYSGLAGPPEADALTGSD